MSMEIVRRLRENRGKLVFENSEVLDNEEELEECGDEELEECDDKEEEILEEDDRESLSTPDLKCICGSTNIVIEDGIATCDDCGRRVGKRVVSSIVKESSEVDRKKAAALMKALEWWKAGHYQKAVQLYKKYGATDVEFSRVLVHSMRESENVEDEDIQEDADLEIITPESESTLDKNIIRAIQTPLSTANKPDLDASISETLRRKLSETVVVGGSWYWKSKGKCWTQPTDKSQPRKEIPEEEYRDVCKKAKSDVTELPSKSSDNEEQDSVDLKTFRWDVYLPRSHRDSRNLYNIMGGKETEYEDEGTKEAAIKAAEDYISTYERGIKDSNYRPDGYTVEDMKQAVEFGKSVLDKISKIPVKGGKTTSIKSPKEDDYTPIERSRNAFSDSSESDRVHYDGVNDFDHTSWDVDGYETTITRNPSGRGYYLQNEDYDEEFDTKADLVHYLKSRKASFAGYDSEKDY